jgi:hypothetical protein
MPTFRTPPRAAAPDHADPTICRAYWDAVTLLDAGWQLCRLRFDSFTRAAVLDLHTPTHRALKVTGTEPMSAIPFREAFRVIRLAEAVTSLGRRGGDLLGDLQWLLASHLQTQRLPQPRRDHVPDPTLSAQPVALRTAFWLLATLVAGYGWQVTNLGEEVAGGGFIADIPDDDVTAVFPSAITVDDTTTAAQLARLIPRLNHSCVAYLRQVQPHTLIVAYNDISA